MAARADVDPGGGEVEAVGHRVAADGEEDLIVAVELGAVLEDEGLLAARLLDRGRLAADELDPRLLHLGDQHVDHRRLHPRQRPRVAANHQVDFGAEHL